MVRAGVSAWSRKWCFNNLKHKYPELRVSASLTEDGTRRIELARAYGKASSQRLTVEQHIRNEQVSGSSPLVGSLFCLQNP
jgi:hypothetical protein